MCYNIFGGIFVGIYLIAFIYLLISIFNCYRVATNVVYFNLGYDILQINIFSFI